MSYILVIYPFPTKLETGIIDNLAVLNDSVYLQGLKVDYFDDSYGSTKRCQSLSFFFNILCCQINYLHIPLPSFQSVGGGRKVINTDKLKCLGLIFFSNGRLINSFNSEGVCGTLRQSKSSHFAVHLVELSVIASRTRLGKSHSSVHHPLLCLLVCLFSCVQKQFGRHPPDKLLHCCANSCVIFQFLCTFVCSE